MHTYQPAANAYEGLSRHMTTATLPLPLIARTQSATACGWAGELWRLHSSGRAHRATRRGGGLGAAAPPPPASPFGALGRKVSAVDGREPDGTRPETRSRRNATSSGFSEAKETVLDANTCRDGRKGGKEAGRERQSPVKKIKFDKNGPCCCRYFMNSTTFFVYELSAVCTQSTSYVV